MNFTRPVAFWIAVLAAVVVVFGKFVSDFNSIVIACPELLINRTFD